MHAVTKICPLSHILLYLSPIPTHAITTTTINHHFTLPSLSATTPTASVFDGHYSHVTSNAVAFRRDVKLVLEGVDKYSNLFGTVLYTPPAVLPSAPAPTEPLTSPSEPQQEHLAEELLKQGLA